MHLYNDGHTPFKRKIKGGMVDPYEDGISESKEEDQILGETKDDPIITDEEIKAELLLKHPPLSRPPPILPPRPNVSLSNVTESLRDSLKVLKDINDDSTDDELRLELLDFGYKIKKGRAKEFLKNFEKNNLIEENEIYQHNLKVINGELDGPLYYNDPYVDRLLKERAKETKKRFEPIYQNHIKQQQHFERIEKYKKKYGKAPPEIKKDKPYSPEDYEQNIIRPTRKVTEQTRKDYQYRTHPLTKINPFSVYSYGKRYPFRNDRTDEEKQVQQDLLKEDYNFAGMPKYEDKKLIKKLQQYNLDYPFFDTRDLYQREKYQKMVKNMGYVKAFTMPEKERKMIKETIKNNGYPVLPKSYGYNNDIWNPEPLPEPKSVMDKEEKPKKKISKITTEETPSKVTIKPEPTVKPKLKPSVKPSVSRNESEIKKVNGMTLPALKEYAKKVGVPFKSTIKKADLHKLIITKLK